MRTVKSYLAVLACLLLDMSPVLAADFYGASVIDKDAPSSFMRLGIYGDHPTVGSVASGSPTERAGFAKGDVVMSINEIKVERAVDLTKCTDAILKIRIFDGLKWKTLTIDRIAVEKEEARQLETKQAAMKNESSGPPFDDQTAAASPLRFDDSSLPDAVVNIVADQPDKSDQTQPDTPTQPLLDDASQDLAGIDW